jgi:hypothetical protein
MNSRYQFHSLLVLSLLLSLASYGINQALANSSTAHSIANIENHQQLNDAEFSLKINDIVTPYDIFSVFVMPGEVIDFEVLYGQADKTYQLIDEQGEVTSSQTNQWQWTAPETAGHQRLIVQSENAKKQVHINVFIKVPAEQVTGGRLKYYKIGHYPESEQIKNKKNYIIPDGFVEVTPVNQNIKISPHFSLKEFVSKQKSMYPKYLYLENKLLLKLEAIRRELLLRGIEVKNVVVMSGYRTPYYNKAIGNVKFSRHVFGDAADIFVDNNGDYRMDDINNDNQHSIADAYLMAEVVESLAKRESFKGLLGGLGIYGPKIHRGAFIHIDTRGYKARWVVK